MIVRYKLDACGIKLKLREWSHLVPDEREALAEMACTSQAEIARYRRYLQGLVWHRTGQQTTPLPPIVDAPWEYGKDVPGSVLNCLHAHDHQISFLQWNNLRVLQRFALIKLSSSAHEHMNFAKALREFSLL
jgi:hypothetical protein